MPLTPAQTHQYTELGLDLSAKSTYPFGILLCCWSKALQGLDFQATFKLL